MRILLSIAIVLSVDLVFSQNYIENPGFEIISDCPREYSKLNLAPPWESPSQGTPDLFNSCDTSENSVGVPNNFMGNLFAHEGNTYAGIHFVFEYNYREYLKTKLKDCLRAGQTYQISFWVSLSGKNNSPVSSEYIGIHISKDDIFFNQREVIPLESNVNFTDTVMLDNVNQWVKMDASYTSTGNEKYMVVGNFHENIDIPFTSNKFGTYLFFDDFKLVNSTFHYLSNCNKIICRGDSILLQGFGLNGNQVSWLDENKNLVSSDSIVWVYPQTDTKYYLMLDSTIYDSVNVIINPRPNEHSNLIVECDTVNPTVYLESSEILNSILWSNGETGVFNIEPINKEGWVFLINQFNCSDTLIFNIDTCSYIICEGDNFSFSSTYTGIAPEWYFSNNPSQILSFGNELNIYPQASGYYFLRDQGQNVDSVKVYLKKAREFELSINCHPNYNEVKITNPYGRVLWSDGKADSYINNLPSGEHWVELQENAGCKLRKNFVLPRNCNSIWVCPNDSVLIPAISGSSGLWYDQNKGETFPGSSDFYVFPDSDNTYIYSASDGSSRRFNVNILDDYEHKFEIMCVNQQAQFRITNVIGSIIWENGTIGEKTQYLTPDNTWVQSKRADGCVFRNELIYEKTCKTSFGHDDLFVPNIITPNNDGKNDAFEIISFLENIELSIYNHLGRLVYQNNSYQNDWDAEGLNNGVYYFIIREPKLREDFKGWVTVLR